MSIYKSDIISLVFEGKDMVADAMVFFHENISSSATAKVLVIGFSGNTIVPLVYSTGTSYSAGETIPANQWYRISTLGPALPSARTAGEAFYPLSSILLETGDACVSIEGVSMNVGADYLPRAGSVFDFPPNRCESVIFQIEDCENLYRFIKSKAIFSRALPVNNGD